MSLIKNGEIRLGKTTCDMCSLPAQIFLGGRALCLNHGEDLGTRVEGNGSIKQAQVEDNLESLKNAHDRLSKLIEN